MSEDNRNIFGIMCFFSLPLLSWLGRYLQPAARAIFDVGIITFRFAAIVPIIDRWSLWRSLDDLRLLLDNDWWISISGRISIRRITVWSISSISPIAVASVAISGRIPIIRGIIGKPAVISISQAISQAVAPQ